MDGRAISFGPFRLLAAQRLLLEGEKPVRLGGRAFDILVEAAEHHVSKQRAHAARPQPPALEMRNSPCKDGGGRRAAGQARENHAGNCFTMLTYELDRKSVV